MLPLVAIGMGRSWSEMTAFLMLDVFKRKTLWGEGVLLLLLPWDTFIGEGEILKSYFSKKMLGVYVNRPGITFASADTDLYKTGIFVASGL